MQQDIPQAELIDRKMQEVIDRIRTRETITQVNPDCPICYETNPLNLVYPCCANIVCFKCYIKLAMTNLRACPMCR